MGCTQKVQMFKRIPRNPLSTHMKTLLCVRDAKNQILNDKTSKSVYGFEAKNNLL
jgi:hypothetical protein